MAIKISLKAPEGRKGNIDFESYSENKRSNPSPEEKRHDTGEKDYTHTSVIKGKGGKSRDSQTFKRRGNTQTKKTRSSRDVSDKDTDAKSSWKSDAKVVESGGKYKDKFGNYQSKKHAVTAEQESKSKSTKYIGKKKPKKIKGTIREVKSDQPSYKKLYGDMLG
tara:strand:- start:486 stop:977 length:492 start_codon:yes stop_codon:yes gene_type:complete